MARSTRKSLAGQAASAARKVISRRTRTEETPAKKAAPATKAPAKAAAKKAAPAKKALAKAAAKKAPARTAATKAAPAKAAAKKAAPAKKTPAKKAPAKKAPVKKTSAATKQASAKTVAAAKKAPAKAAAKKATSVRATAKKTPARTLAVKEGEGAWTKPELKEVLDELHAQRDHSSAIIQKQEEELSGLMRDAGDGAGHDQADMGATSFERDHELTVLSHEHDKLAQIERALARIEDGTYGVCESCGNPIGKMRAMAFPRATLCMTCKQREERR